MTKTKQEWIAEFAARLIASGHGENTSWLLAKATAQVHENNRGLDVTTWPDGAVRPILETRDDSDIDPPLKP